MADIPPDERGDDQNKYNDLALGDLLSVETADVFAENVQIVGLQSVRARARARYARARV